MRQPYIFFKSIEDKFSRFKLSIVIFFVLGLSFYYLLNVGWLRWGNLIVDTPRELWLPLKLLEGKVLYKDLWYPFGFFPPYFLALIYKIFGVHINTLVGCGIGITLLTSVFIYKIARFFLDEVDCGITVLTFLFVLAFPYYQLYSGIFNFILPYSFAATFFILFVSASLYLFLKFISTASEKWLFFWSLSLSLAFLTRPEMSFPVWAGFVLSVIIFKFKNKSIKFLKLIFYLFLPLIISFSLYGLFFFKFDAFAAFKEGIIGCFKSGLDTKIILKSTGLADIYTNSCLAVKSLLFHLIIILLVVFSALFLNNKGRHRFLLFFPGISIIFLAYWLGITYLAGDLQYRCIPLLLLITLIGSAYKVIRFGDFKHDLSILVLCLISLATLTRIFFNSTPFGYGFYLLIPGLVFYYIFFLKLEISLLKIYLPDYAQLVKKALIPFFVLLILPYWYYSFSNYALRDLEITSAKGKIVCLNDRVAEYFWQTVDYLKANTLASDKVVVLPEGVSVNYFSGRDNPLRYYQFFALEPSGRDDAKIIQEFIRFDIDYIVIIARPAFEYGQGFFGIDFGKELYSWLHANYEPIKKFGAKSYLLRDFGIMILKNKS